ncbi:methyl-accepting chemotaxis protein [bacterium]|nr:methyl-accepting chemotaxis protein [bacterium]
MWFYDLKIRTKLLCGFIFVAVIAGTIGLVGVSGIRKVADADKTMYERMTVPISQLSDIAVGFYEVHINLRNMMMTRTLEERKQHISNIRELTAEIKKASDEYEKTIITDKMRDNFEHFKQSRQEFAPLRDRIIELALQGRDSEAIAILRGPAAASTKAEQDAIDAMLKMKVSQANQTSVSNTSTAKNVFTIVVLLMIAGVSVAVGLGWFMSTVISRPVVDIAAAAEKVANGDLTINIESKSKDEIGSLCTSFRRMIENLRSVVHDVRQSAETVSASSQELSGASKEVTQGTQQIGDTIGQVAAGSQEQSKTAQSSSLAMEQLSRAIDEVASGAQAQARQVENTVALIQQISSSIEDVAKLSQDSAVNGQRVSEVAADGGKEVIEAVDGMHRIKQATDRVAEMVIKLGESSQQIGAIVETIDDIAEQTNLLALNAAIEAARAGEHGKGFAVVADEVRKLAERSSKATGEIADLIGDIQEMTKSAVEAMNHGSQEVSDGTELANRAGEALKNIQSSIEGIVGEIHQISANAQHVSSSSADVVRSIENVSSVTQQTTAAAQEMSASSTEVCHQIEQVAALSEQNAAATEEVSATTEEQNAAAEELNASAEELADMAGQLQELVSHFKLDDDIRPGSVHDISSRVAQTAHRKAA